MTTKIDNPSSKQLLSRGWRQLAGTPRMASTSRQTCQTLNGSPTFSCNHSPRTTLSSSFRPKHVNPAPAIFAVEELAAPGSVRMAVTALISTGTLSTSTPAAASAKWSPASSLTSCSASSARRPSASKASPTHPARNPSRSRHELTCPRTAGANAQTAAHPGVRRRGHRQEHLRRAGPKPIFVPTEDGLDEIACDKFPLTSSYDDVLAALSELRSQLHDYETVMLDSLDWLERLIWDKLCNQYGVSSIEKVDGGYAKGYTHALTYWREIIDHLGALRHDRDMVVLMIAHSKVERFEDPEPLRPLLAPAAQARRGAGLRVVRRGALRHAEVPDPERGRWLRPQADHRPADRRLRRRTHPPLRRRTQLRGQKPLWNRRGIAPVVGRVHDRLDPIPSTPGVTSHGRSAWLRR